MEIVIFGFAVRMAIIWLALAVVFLIVEGITVGLTTIWFAAGAFVALLLSLINVNIVVQVIAFLAVSLCLLIFTRKFFVEKLKTGSEKTNVDALIGEEGIVVVPIEAFAAGQVKVGSQIWTAVAKDAETTIAKDSRVKVQRIEGVKLIVKALD